MLPAGGLDDVEEDQQRDRERGLARRRTRSRPGASPANRTASGSRTQSSVVSVPMAASTRADREADDRAEQRRARRSGPVFSALERSTDSVPSTTQNECCTPVRSATRTARPSADRAAHAVVQPHRVPLDVRGGALLCGRQRVRRRPRAGGRAAGRASCAARRPRPARCCCAICETAKLSSCARKLGSSEVMNSLDLRHRRRARPRVRRGRQLRGRAALHRVERRA